MAKRAPAKRPSSPKRPATRPPAKSPPHAAKGTPARGATPAARPAPPPKAKKPAPETTKYTMWKMPVDDLKPMQPRLAAVLQATPGVEEAHVVGVRVEGQDLPKPTLVLVLNNRASEDDVVQRLLPRLAPALPRDTTLDLCAVRPGEELLEWARRARGLVFRRTA